MDSDWEYRARAYGWTTNGWYVHICNMMRGYRSLPGFGKNGNRFIQKEHEDELICKEKRN